jgi:hypothetical protein
MNGNEPNTAMFEPGDPLMPIGGNVAPLAAWSPDLLADCHASLRQLYAYWDARRGVRAMPARSDIDPIDLKAFLPVLILIDVVADARRYTYRLVGTHEVEMRGRDPTGKSILEAYYGESAEDTIFYLDHVVQTREPVLYRGTYQPLTTRTQRDDVLFLPLSKDGEAVNMIMLFSHTDWVRDEALV